MRPFLLFLGLSLPLGTAAGQRMPLRLCVWDGQRLERLTAFYDRPANALFTSATGNARLDVTVATDTLRGYARTAPWYINDETIRLGEGTFASWRMAAALDEAQLEFVGRRARVPYFRRPADRVETMYVLVGPGFRADGPMLYTPDGHCEFQPYRRISDATTGQ